LAGIVVWLLAGGRRRPEVAAAQPRFELRQPVDDLGRDWLAVLKLDRDSVATEEVSKLLRAAWAEDR
jgi:hypothetical protein